MDTKTTETSFAASGALENFERAENAIQWALRELQRYKESFIAADSPKTKADILGWAIQHMARGSAGVESGLLGRLMGSRDELLKLAGG
jgi:hypothetical protein